MTATILTYNTCANCGATPEPFVAHLTKWISIQCMNDDCGVRPYTRYCETMGDAIRAWNTRATIYQPHREARRKRGNPEGKRANSHRLIRENSMSRTAQTHDRENAPRQLQHAARGRHLPPLRRTPTRRTSGVQHGPWLTGDPSARGAKRGNGMTRRFCRALWITADRRALRRPNGESAIY
jgi:hypothetical protein